MMKGDPFGCPAVIGVGLMLAGAFAFALMHLLG